MTWRPNLRVTVSGVDVAADTVDRLTAERGRDDPFQQPRAGYLRLSLLDPSTVPTLLDPVAVEVDHLGQWVPLWTGEVSDVDVELQTYGALGQVTVANVTAVGPLAKVHRGEVDPDGYPQALDGERIAAVLAGALTRSWDTVTADRTWQTEPAGRTWLTVDGSNPELIDDGLYPVQANLAGRDPWRIIQQAANDGGGSLYETRDGQIGYADSTRRLADVQAGGYLEPPDTTVLPGRLRAGVAFGDLANVVELTYSTGTVTARDDDAVRKYGAVLLERVSTELLEQADAQARADLLVQFRSRDARRVDRLDLDLADADVPDAVRFDLLTVDPGQPLRLTNLPDPVVPGSWSGFVEAVRLDLDRHAVRLSLTVSPYELSTFGGRWLVVPDATRWSDADPTLTWPQAEELIP